MEQENGLVLEREEKITWVPIGEVVPFERNRNHHSKEQIERLAKLISHYGWRHPLIVWRKTNQIAAGHCRLEAARHLGLNEVPVHYQDFRDEEEFSQFAISDNAIGSEWSELDLAGINLDIGAWGPDFDLELLGFKDFRVDAADFENILPKADPKDKDSEMMTCPNCGVVIEKNG